MLGITIKNILKNKILSLCLVLGFILSIAVVSAVPMYSNSVLDNYIRVLLKSAEEKSVAQAESKASDEVVKKSDSKTDTKTQTKPENKNTVFEKGDEYVYPASVTLLKVLKFNTDYKTFSREYSQIKSNFFQEARKINIPALAEKVILTLDPVKYNYTKDNNTYFSAYNKIKYIAGFLDHINIVEGKLPSTGPLRDNTVEVVVDRGTFSNFSLELGKPYEIVNVATEKPFYIKVAGVFEVKDKKESFWADGDNSFYCEFMTSEQGFLNILKDNQEYINYAKEVVFNVSYDMQKINNGNATAAYKTIETWKTVFKNRADSTVSSTLADNLRQYVQKEAIYNTVVWIFLIPILIVVMFYIWMVSGFIVDADSEQIGILKSRGASKFEIMKLYLYEGVILSIVGLIAGPMLGTLLCKAISYSDGFLIFDPQQGIDISFSNKVYEYSIITVIILLLTLLTAVYFASQRSIVEIRQSKNRYMKVIFKNKYMDFILLAVAFYGYYNYGINKNIAVLSNVKTDKAPLDPLLYLISTVFIIGAGLFLLRIYKYLVQLIFMVGKNKYPTAIYVALINVMRYHLKKSSAMLFIIITVSLSIFDMHISKDINTSFTNTVKYMNGSDIVLRGSWVKVVDDSSGAGENGYKMETYYEPPYTQYSKIEGIENYTKVLKSYEGEARSGTSTGMSCNILGIIPHEFGKTAYFDGYVLKTHWYNYLNAMTKKQDYVLISSALASSASFKAGDLIYYKLGPGTSISGRVLDIVDYWPGYGSLQSRNLIISNLNYVFKKTPIYPYEIWMRKKTDASFETVYSSMIKEELKLTQFKSLNTEMFNAKSDVFLKGTNAILNLSFISIAVITVLGFIIYWMISLKTRTLSFGIYRSLGLSSKGITLTLIVEQLLTLGSSILVGVIVGNLVGKLFLPLIKDLWYKNRFVIPAKNLEYLNEYLQLGAILLIIFIVSFGVLRSYIGKLKIHQAIKLGED